MWNFVHYATISTKYASLSHNPHFPSFRVYFSRAVQLRATFLGKVYILVVCFKRKVYICDRNYNGKVYASKKDPV